MSKLVYNERSWAIDVISEINKWASSRELIINRAGGESTLKGGEKSRFPDVLLYGSEDSGWVLQGWELKMPDVDINDRDLFDNAKEKANTMNLKSFLLWNVTTAKLFKIDEEGECELVCTWNQLSHINKRVDVESNRSEWIAALHQMLEDLVEYFNNGEIRPTKIIDSITGEGLSEIILNHTHSVGEHLKKVAVSDSELSDQVTLWWIDAKAEYIDYKTPWEPLAKLILTSWINKLIFARILNKYTNAASKMDLIRDQLTLKDGIDIINKISNHSKFGYIFKSQLGEAYITEQAWEDLKQINEMLIDTRIEYIEGRSMQTIISSVINRSTRRIYGQFTTPNELASFIASLVITDKNKNTIDTCCGTGTIAKACYLWKLHSGVSEKHALETTYASDKLEYPLQLTAMTLTSPDNINESINVFQKDVIDLNVGDKISIFNPEDNEYTQVAFPKMSYIISNLPFVQQEDLKKMNPRMQQEVNDFLSSILEEQITINGKADLYAYIPFKQWTLLEDDGTLGIIVSNSWLATEWGNQFYELLKRFYHIEYVIASNNGRWFTNADVVTNILVLKKRSASEIKKHHNIDEEITRFILLNQNIYELATTDSIIDYNKLNEIATCIRQNREDIRFSCSSYTQAQIDALLDLGISKNALFGNISWLLRIKDKILKMSEVFDITRGERRGWDPMFYPAPENGIESKYIKPVVKTSREIEGYIAEPKSDAFCCTDSIEVLASTGAKGALNWIKLFEGQVNGTGKPLVEVLKRTNTNWYTMRPDSMAEICISVNPGDRLFFSRLKEPAFVNQRLMRLVRTSKKYDLQLLSALMNSLLGLFYIEALGFGRGLGALDLTPTNLKKNAYMLNPELLSEKKKEEIIAAFTPLEHREVFAITKEIEQLDRVNFDNVVLNAFDILDLKESIKKSLLELYGLRTSVK